MVRGLGLGGSGKAGREGGGGCGGRRRGLLTVLYKYGIWGR